MIYEYKKPEYDYSLTHPQSGTRRNSRSVPVGDLAVGGNSPIRVQSMTTTLTTDVKATAEQSARMIEAGCEIVRVTTPNISDVRAMPDIRKALKNMGHDVPLVADVHFNPGVAYEAAAVSDKVRINPGNFADGKRFLVQEYTESEYSQRLKKVEDKLVPLIKLLKKHKSSLRLGVNHGSLSDRVLNRYGDTPEGMVQACLEYLTICENEDYRDIIISLKASNPKVMIQAYRLLARRLDEGGRNYPFHLGVTEAGGGLEGRLKSAVGIGALLDEGLGDTIRVSLTEDPAEEIPVAFKLLGLFKTEDRGLPASLSSALPPISVAWDPTKFSRRSTHKILLGSVSVGGDAPVRVGSWSTQAGLWETPEGDESPELVFCPPGSATEKGPWSLGLTIEGGDFIWGDPRVLPPKTEIPRIALADAAKAAQLLDAAKKDNKLVLALRASTGSLLTRSARWLAAHLAQAGLKNPIILFSPSADPLESGSFLGGLLADGIGDAIVIPGPAKESAALGRRLLQAAGARISMAEYIACPGCGRTLFDLESTTNRIRSKTKHLKGIRIAVMGCIVNGPGEMADAHFGYVGGAPGKVNLYVGKECIEKHVPEDLADERLIALIKSRGLWKEA